MMEHLEESTNVVKSNRKLIGAILANIALAVLLVMMNVLIPNPESSYFLAGVFCLMIVSASVLLYQIIKKF